MQIETADELRLRLKNERNARTSEPSDQRSSDLINSITTSSSSRDTIEYSPDFGSEDQRDQRPVQGLHNGIRGTKRTTGNTERKLNLLSGSLAQVNQRKRSADRRPSEDHSQDRSNGTDVSASPPGRSTGSTRTVGNLEALEAIPPRTFNSETASDVKEPETSRVTSGRKRGRPPKSRVSSPQPLEVIEEQKPSIIERGANFLKAGNVLSEREAKALKDPLVAALQDELSMIDKLIWSYTEDPLQQPIWSDLTEKDLDGLTNLLLKMGQRVPVVASAARVAVDGSDYVTTAMLLAPRFQSTVSVVREARKKKAQNAQNQPKQSTISRLRRNRQQANLNPIQ